MRACVRAVGEGDVKPSTLISSDEREAGGPRVLVLTLVVAGARYLFGFK